MNSLSINNIDKNRLLSCAVTAQILCISRATLKEWRLQNCGPVFIQLSNRSIRYMLTDVYDWLESKKKNLQGGSL